MKKYIEYIAKLLPVVFVVAGGQALSIFFLSYITNNYDASGIDSIANIDAAFSLMLGITTIGIGQYYSRKLLNKSQFDYYLAESRSVRLVLGGTISVLGCVLLLIGNVEYGTVFLAGIVASLGVEYALYAKGKSLHASLVSFFRMSGVYFLTIVLLFYIEHASVDESFLYSFYAAIVLSSCLSIYFAKTKLTWNFTIPSRKVVISIFSLGGAFYLYSSVKFFIIPISYYLLGGVGDLYVFVKMYLLFFSVRRVYVQVFYSYLRDENQSIRLNSIYFIGSLMLVLLLEVSRAFYGVDLFFSVLKLEVRFQYELYLLIVVLGLFSVYPSRLLIVEGDSVYKVILYGASMFTLMGASISLLLGSEVGVLFSVILLEALVGFGCWIFCKRYSSVKGGQDDLLK